ncbi:MAG: hypothetical protein EXS30_07570 [Pedosphaera sp.]|nr:hypothetical protein [Pedosphaera sp.]
MTTGILLTVYSCLILAASLVGGWIPLWIRLTHTRLQVATSFVAGLMLGVGFLHLLPHSWQQLQDIDLTMRWVLGGFAVMFFIQRFFHFHHHDVPEEAPEVSAEHLHSHECQHQHEPATLAEKSAHHLSWAGAAAGLTIHTLIDGITLAASVRAESGIGTTLAGLGVFLVIILHKPFDAMTIGTLMAAGGWPRGKRHLVNVLFAIAIPVGVILFTLGIDPLAPASGLFLGAALAFAAGSFFCIAASDLLPELQFHAHDRVKLSLSLLAGLGLAVLVGKFEHDGHDQSQKTGQVQDSKAVEIKPPF